MPLGSNSAGLPNLVLLAALASCLTVPSFVSAADDPDLAAYEGAISTYRAGDCNGAVVQLSAVAAAKPQANLPLARCYFEAESYGKAADAATAYLQKFPDDEQGTLLLCRAYENQTHSKDAIKVITEYVNRHPDSLNARVELGRIYLREGDKAAASAQFQQVAKAVPGYPGAILGQALVAMADAHWAEAITLLNNVSSISPNLPEVYKALGDVYERQGQCDKAVKPYSQAVDLKPSDFTVSKALAKCYVKLEKWDQVASVLRTGSVAEANDPEATELVQRALQDKPQETQEYSRAVIELNPMNAVAHRINAQSLYASKNTERAKTEFLEILKLEKNDPDPEIYFRLGQMSEADKKLDEARHYYEEAVKLPRSKPEMAFTLARLDLALNDPQAAKAALARLGSPEIETPDYKTMIAEVDLRTGDYNAASDLLTALLARDQNNKKLLDFSAETATKQEKFADAATFLERLFALDPNDRGVRYRLVTLYTDHAELKRDQRAVDFLKDFVTKQEQDPEGYLLLANLYRKNKDWSNAKVYFDLGFSHMPNPPPARFSWAYQSYAMYYFNQGNLQEALANFTQATQLDPGDTEGQYRLGIVCIKLNNQDALEQVLSVLDSKDPKRAAQLEEQARKSGLSFKPRTAQ